MSEEKKDKVGFWGLTAKLGSKLLSVLVKCLKAFKFTKVGLFALSFAGYAAVFSWKFAILLMIALGFHESGHVWSMKKMGIKTKGFYYIPFVGGAAIAEEQYKTYGENVFIAIMGPIWGAGLAWACGGIYWLTGNPLWAASAAWMATLNLFNLLPVNPLDGGQLIRSISFSIHKTLGLGFLIASIILGIILMWKLKIGLFALILFVAGIELFFEVYSRRKLRLYLDNKIDIWELPNGMTTRDENGYRILKHYPYSMNLKQIIAASFSYIAVIIVLVILLMLTKHVPGADLAANFLR